jgi:hypothetical protein
VSLGDAEIRQQEGDRVDITRPYTRPTRRPTLPKFLSMLRRLAYDPVLIIGGRLGRDDLHCHSWIEVDGEPLCEFNDARKDFKVLFAYGA